MNTIDHRILIQASPEIVWNFISNIDNNPSWQVDCREVAFLNSLRNGQGMRWRQTNENGREFIYEVTSWYNQLGYEYAIIDGASFKTNKGVIRLQEIAEGTIVQWTFNYELGGMFSGLRNAMGAKRNIENAIVDSLWTLWRHITQAKDRNDDFHARSLMREAPDVEARAHYQPRHPSVIDMTDSSPAPPPLRPEVAQSFQPSSIDEPPIVDDDTRPRPAITEEAAATPQTSADSTVKEPDFLSGVSTDTFDSIPPNTPYTASEDEFTSQPEDERFRPSVTSIDKVPSEAPSVEPVEESTASEAVGEPVQQTSTPEEPTAEPTTADEPGKVVTPPEETEVLPGTIPPVDPLEDTSQVSVFELFGLKKPSETQEIDAVKIDPAPVEDAPKVVEQPAPPTPIITDVPAPTAEDTQPKSPVEVMTSSTVVIKTGGRTGKRYALRQNLVNLRRPKSDE